MMGGRNRRGVLPTPPAYPSQDCRHHAWKIARIGPLSSRYAAPSLRYSPAGDKGQTLASWVAMSVSKLPAKAQ